LEDLKRKKAIFERHCETEGRDPSTALLTVGVGLLLVKNQRNAASVVERIPAARRLTVVTATLPQAAELLGEYIDAGFGGFTFSNQTLPTTDSIELAGELIEMMRGSQTAV
jgi:hypothetical protein